MSLILTPAERHALDRATRMLGLDYGRFALSVLTGALGLASAVALSGIAAWLIARASLTDVVVALGVAPVLVRLFGVSRSLLRYCERLVSHDTALRGMNALRTRVYEVMASSRTDTVAALRRGDVLARVGADVDRVGDLVVRAYLPAAVAATVGLLTSLIVGLIYWPAGLILAACLLLAGLGGPLMTVRAARAAELARQEESTDLAAISLTVLEDGAELGVLGRMGPVMDALESTEARMAAARDRAARPAAAAAAVDALAMGLSVIGSILVGLPAVHSGALSAEWLAVITLLPLSAFEATAALGPASVQLVTSAGAAVRVIELVEAAEASRATVPAPTPLPPLDEAQGGPVLRARGLAVGWPGGPVVAQGIDLELRPGRSLAIAGPSGIGKTTLLYTLAGLLAPRAGTVELDGVPVWSAPRAQVHERLSVTTEDAHVFATSVLENLRVAWGRLDAPTAEEHLAAAGLEDWYRALPQGLDTMLGEGGQGVSGGERRRLLLARALCSPARLMMLDEPAEHLDPATADRLVGGLLAVGHEDSALVGAESARGVLVVTHRLSALAGADEVIVLGRPDAQAPSAPATVTDRGTHDELRGRNTAYAWSLAQEDLAEDPTILATPRTQEVCS
ncbi:MULTISPECIES: thiol reductant ABC exporter subunit CydC [Actinomyces]|uniref:Thiol reductant ABC exporter subunit CydC n=1 Tax=Actinomyces respiraculi TaxID=2744574 RepID=A0A7T0LK69_9ACTO|nr:MULTISPECIES: thiol reductant ABC exporter subunit CydC [Actinomyces]QPL04683.1 thiol reductant ABC exporter subunit CydC [Actinomyces respiraculi]